MPIGLTQTPTTYGVGIRSIRRQRWAESAPTEVASGRIGVRAIAVIPLRARNRLRRPQRKFPIASRPTQYSCLRPGVFRRAHLPQQEGEGEPSVAVMRNACQSAKPSLILGLVPVINHPLLPHA
jgi:hypothetical protein